MLRRRPGWIIQTPRRAAAITGTESLDYAAALTPVSLWVRNLDRLAVRTMFNKPRNGGVRCCTARKRRALLIRPDIAKL